MKKKRISLVMALALVLTCVIGGTIAWLTAETDPVVNTFTVGDINITLTETDSKEDVDNNLNTNSYKMIPGNTIVKDPTVTVEANSEACWLFVKVEKSTNFDDFMTYDMFAGWTALTGQDGVYYREVAATTTDVNFAVLDKNQVTVNSDVTKSDLNVLTEATYPTLTFTAYAVQKANVETVSEAWTIATATN